MVQNQIDNLTSLIELLINLETRSTVNNRSKVQTIKDGGPMARNKNDK